MIELGFGLSQGKKSAFKAVGVESDRNIAGVETLGISVVMISPGIK
jgi:hypothetical protein